MTQGILNFTVESTDERLTPRAGTTVFGEFLRSVGIDRLCNTYLPSPGSNRGYAPFAFIEPLLLMLHSGGKSLEDVRIITHDKALRHLLSIEQVPTADTIGKWLKRTADKSAMGMKKINQILLKRYLKRIDDPVVLDIDATVIESHKSIARTTYKMFPGFTPILGHINGGYVIHQEFRAGNVAPADGNLKFVKACQAQLPSGKSISYLRADSASYQAALFDWCKENNITYTVGGHLDKRVLSSIKEITEWEPLETREGVAHHYEEYVAEFVHTMEKTRHAFRMIVVKKSITPVLHGLEQFLSEEELLALTSEHYQVIATNSETMTPQQIVYFYRQRGESSENRIKELKNGFNLKYLPTSHFGANTLYFHIGTMAYNLFILFRQLLQPSWHRHTIQTIRYKLYHIAGKVITHARQTILKVNHAFTSLINQIRQRCYDISLE